MSPADSERDVPPSRRNRARSVLPDELAVRIDGDDVYVDGVLDAANSNLLLASIEYLQSSGRTDIRVDLAGVDRIENEGVRVLFDGQNALADAGGELHLFVPDALRPRLALCQIEPATSSDDPVGGGAVSGPQAAHG